MSENKRKHPGKQSGLRKRYKSDGTRITSTTIHGPGVFVTCVKGKERQAAKELKDVFESISQELWPERSDRTQKQLEDTPSGDDSDEEDEDLEARVFRDRARLQSEETAGKTVGGEIKTKKRIIVHYTDTPCSVCFIPDHNSHNHTSTVIFIGCASPLDPVKLSLAYLEDVKRTGMARTRAVQRLEPIVNTCVAALPELLLLGENVLRHAFKEDEKSTYKVIAKVRNSGKLSSQKIIEELPRKVPEGHKVSLTSPDLIVFVSVFKSIAGISVLPKYEELKRYNVAQLVDAKDLELDKGQGSRLSKQPGDLDSLTTA